MVSTTPLYQRIYDDLKAAIKSGSYQQGDRIPSEAELSQKYSVSRITVRRAIEDLCSDGYLMKMQGRGTFVGTRHLSSRLAQTRDTRSCTELCAEIGAQPGSHVVDRQIVPARPDEVKFFGLGKGALLLFVRRVRMADGLPIGDERVLIPYDWAADLLTAPLENRSIFDAIEGLIGRRPHSTSVWTVNAGRASTEQAALLGISAGDPMLNSETYYVDKDGRPVCISRDYFVGGRYELDLA